LGIDITGTEIEQSILAGGPESSVGSPRRSRACTETQSFSVDGPDQVHCEKEPRYQAVRVVVRFRPPVSREELRAFPAFVVEPSGTTVESADLQHRFHFDRVFGQDTDQRALYDDVGRPIVDGVLEGFHGTILAYGQTGSGKTHCMFGPQGSHPLELQGVVPRATQRVFECLGCPNVAELAVECSFFEVYCEQVRDLLRPTSRHFHVGESPQRGLCVEGLFTRP